MMGAIIRSTSKTVAVSLLIIYGVIPPILYFVPQIHLYVVYLHFVKWPLMDYSHPQQLGVHSYSRNFYLDVDESRIGVWQILPKGVAAKSNADFDRALSESKHPIIVYNHGNCWTRVAPHRVKLYNLLADAGYHVIAFDYRGYGDSPGFPTEDGMIKDALTIYEWTMRKRDVGNAPVFVWGHSLGTAITTAMVGDLCTRGRCPDGVLLECPFNNLKDVISNHFLSLMFRWIPWMDKFLVEPVLQYGLKMNSDERIKNVKCPVLIMHDRFDLVVPFHLGEKLHQAAANAGVDVTFVEFRNHGHKYICNAPELPDIVNNFVKKSTSKIPPVIRKSEGVGERIEIAD